jgi:hypothetical protein
MFIVTGVDEDYPFAAKTRNEIEVSKLREAFLHFVDQTGM